MGFLHFVAMVSTGMMLVSPNEITFLNGKNFLPIDVCPEQVKCDSGNCYARSITFTPATGSCGDLINGSKKENIFKVIRPSKASFTAGDTSYFDTKDTCCVHWVDETNEAYSKSEEKLLKSAKQPYTADIAFVWLFMALLATLMVLVDFFRAMYEECGVREWINVTLENRIGDTAKDGLSKIVPKSNVAVIDDKVKETTDEKWTKAPARRQQNCFTVTLLRIFQDCS